MSSTVLAARAVSSVYVVQVLRPLLLIGIGVYSLVIAIVIWLAVAVSPWWLLLGVIPTIIFCACLTAWVIIRVMAGRLAPDLSTKQKRMTKKVVKHIGVVAEQLGTPRFVLLFRVIRDVVLPLKSKQTLISELAETPGQLHRDFDALRKSF